ncbi:MAG: hypothetical protein SGJ04_03050 [Bacteroidota bacterium]|nr:hypothetical protein [Bacteroidota bacterium]
MSEEKQGIYPNNEFLKEEFEIFQKDESQIELTSFESQKMKMIDTPPFYYEHQPLQYSYPSINFQNRTFEITDVNNNHHSYNLQVEELFIGKNGNKILIKNTVDHFLQDFISIKLDSLVPPVFQINADYIVVGSGEIGENIRNYFEIPLGETLVGVFVNGYTNMVQIRASSGTIRS